MYFSVSVLCFAIIPMHSMAQNQCAVMMDGVYFDADRYICTALVYNSASNTYEVVIDFSIVVGTSWSCLQSTTLPLPYSGEIIGIRVSPTLTYKDVMNSHSIYTYEPTVLF